MVYGSEEVNTMRVRLDALEFELNDPYVFSDNVSVHFEHEKLEDHYLKFFMNAYVGNTDVEDSYRFHLKLIYIIDLNGVDYCDDAEMTAAALTFVIPSFSNLIIVLDEVILDKERH